MTQLMHASRQWATRPADERFCSLPDMHHNLLSMKQHSKEAVVSSAKLQAVPEGLHGLKIAGPNGHQTTPTHHAFQQLATLSGSPANYLRRLPSPLAADCLNYGLQFGSPRDVGILLSRQDADVSIRAATGPNYGRIWNADVVATLISMFGDGITGHFRVPGEFGEKVEVTKDNTTLYAGDTDMFVFLADEENRIEVPNRRNGQSGSLARGFFVWNSEVGTATLGLGFFLFDYVCCNRIVWGAEDYVEKRIRHTASAPDRWDVIVPMIKDYSKSSATAVTKTLIEAQSTRLGDNEAKVTEFLRNRFTAKVANAAQQMHMLEENRPIETIWDAVTGLTAYARTIENQDVRVSLERQAGNLLRAA